MPRPKRLRLLEAAPAATRFVPEGTAKPVTRTLLLRLDEFEAMRLADFAGLSHAKAARRMRISRATFGRIVESGRRTLTQALLQGCNVEITGGAFRYARKGQLQCPRCKHRQPLVRSIRGAVNCRRCIHLLQNIEDSPHPSSRKVQPMDIQNTRIAIVTEEGTSISSHFGRAPFYEVLSFENGNLVHRERREKFAPHRQSAEHGQHHDGGHDHHHDGGHHHSQRHDAMLEAIRDCQVVIARGMGNGAYEHLTRAGFTTLLTSLQTIQQVIDAVKTGTLDHQPLRIHHKDHGHA